MSKEKDSDPFSIFRKTQNKTSEKPSEQYQNVLDNLQQEDDYLIPPENLQKEHPADTLLTISDDSDFETTDPTPQRKAPLQKDQKKQKAKGNILILGNDQEHVKSFVSSLSDENISNSKNPRLDKIFAGTAIFKGGHILNILGILENDLITSLLDVFTTKTLGAFILINPDTVNWSYYTYLLETLLKNHGILIRVVITSENELDSKLVRDNLQLSPDSEILFESIFDDRNSKKMLFSLFKQKK